LGWARANIFYDKLAAPPEPGSLQEALCLLVFRYRQEQEFYAAYSALHGEGSKGRVDTANSYRESMFPYAVRARTDRARTAKQIMDEAFLAGPLYKISNEDE